MKRTSKSLGLYDRIRQILESARTGLSRTVNTTQVVANWLIGQEIIEEEQKGKRRAGYGKGLMERLSQRLAKDYGTGYSVQNLRYMRQFYLEFPALLRVYPIRHALRGELPFCTEGDAGSIRHAVRGEFEYDPKAWTPSGLHPNLSWTHYRTLLGRNQQESRDFYLIEAVKNNWTSRELERQINSLLYERLALSKDKKGVLRLAKKGQEIEQALDVFKDPLVLEFLKIPASPKLVESKLEENLINNLQTFLLELGKGFAFVARDKNDAVVRYTLGAEKGKKIFASRYKLHLPSEAELKAELKRELRQLGWPKKKI